VLCGKSTIGSGSTVGKDSKIKDSVIGKNVLIGIYND
jgi:NDP-sugar pyrophosphorylase family protein